MTDDSNRPYRKSTRLNTIFKHIPAIWGNIRAGDVLEASKQQNALLGFVLMACTAEQVKFLSCIWDEFYPDEDVVTTFTALSKFGKLVDILDWTSPAARERIILTNIGVQAARGRQ